MSTPTSTNQPETTSSMATGPERLWPYALIGLIQEMFRFQSFHMYGIIGSAVGVGALGVWLIKRFEARSMTHRPMEIPTDRFEAPGYQYWLGGTAFGLGWGLLGACPGPIYVLIGNGVTVMIAAFLSALVGVWTYAALRHRLPHS